LVRASVDLRELVEDAVAATAPAAAGAGVAVRLDAPAAVIAEVDAHRVRQVVDNLLSNAVKYTEPGGAVTLALGEADGEVALDVSDTGIGIAADELEHVFARFFRGGQAQRQHIPGTGIGLSIVSAIVEAHGGRIEVDSEPGRGTTFRVRLPRVPAPASDTSEVDAPG
jgi:signal transduction histidine kinase